MNIVERSNKQKILLLGDDDTLEGINFSNIKLSSLKEEVWKKAFECEIVIYIEHGIIKVLKNVLVGYLGKI